MNKDISVFIDPETQRPLRSKNDSELISESGVVYRVIKGVPRFVSSENYASGFGAQWNDFPKTQLDSYSGLSITETRLERCLQGHLLKLGGKRVLEAGSGAGRFTEILLKYGAKVHSFDFSNAVEANASNNGSHPSLSLAQADILRMPFERASYDYVICLGVLQHTPDPEESIRRLWEMLVPGGYLVIDHYRKSLRGLLTVATHPYRAVIRRLPARHQMKVVKSVTDFFFPVHWALKDSLLAQRILRRVSPVHFYYPHLGLVDKQMYYEWALLDTHDATTDRYKHHRTVVEIEKFLQSMGAQSLRVSQGGNGVEAFCLKP